MGAEPNLREQAQITETLRRHAEGFTACERRAEAIIGGGFALAVIALVTLFPPAADRWHPVAMVACSAALIVALRAEFDIGSGFTVPVQLAFVPLLFTMPASLVPVAVMLAGVAAYLPDVVRAGYRGGRLVRFAGNAWFAVGPAAVLSIAHVESAATAAPLVLIAALAAQFAGDLAASTVRDVVANQASLREQLNEVWIYAIDLGLTPIGLLVAWRIDTQPWAVLSLPPLLIMLGIFGRERRRRVQSLVELNSAYRGTALLLGNVVEADDEYTGEHSRGVVELALRVGSRLGVSDDQLRNLEFGALLHDVGKVAIPKEIINKPGKLDAREWEIIKTHTVEGQRMLDQVGGFMSEVGRIVRSHHERWDGNGYPDKLQGQAIPLEARIISACDTWSAMTTTRPYRAALPDDVAAEELRSCAGTQLDPEVVAATLAVVQAESFVATIAPAVVRNDDQDPLTRRESMSGANGRIAG